MPGCAALQLERVLPVVQAVLLALVHVLVELLLHRLRRTLRCPARRPAAGLRRPRAAARRMRVAPGLVDGCCPWRSSTITPAVRLSRMVCRLARAASSCAHALVDRLARVGKLLRHLGEGAREAAELVLALQRAAWGSGRRAPPRARLRPAPAAAARAGCRGCIASSTAPNTARNRLSVSVPMYMRRRPSRASARCWYSRLASCTASALATSVGGRLGHLQDSAARPAFRGSGCDTTRQRLDAARC